MRTFSQDTLRRFAKPTGRTPRLLRQAAGRLYKVCCSSCERSRALCAAPGFTVVALFVLTLSIGTTTAIVSVVDAVIPSGLPFPDADRLVAVGEWNIKSGAANKANEVAPQTSWTGATGRMSSPARRD